MKNNFKLLIYLYKKYETVPRVKTKINIIKKINALEKEIIKSKSKHEIIFFILNNIPVSSKFIGSRYIYILSKLKIPFEYEKSVILLFENIISNDFLKNTNKNVSVSFAILGLKNFKDSEIEEFIFKMLKLKKSNDYLKEFIITLSSISENKNPNILNFFVLTLKKNSKLRSLCFFSIGKISNYKNRPLLKRKLLNPFLKYSITFLKKNENKKEDLNNLYFALIEICKVDSGLKGELLNKLLEILQLDKRNNYLKEILINTINNK